MISDAWLEFEQRFLTSRALRFSSSLATVDLGRGLEGIEQRVADILTRVSGFESFLQNVEGFDAGLAYESYAIPDFHLLALEEEIEAMSETEAFAYLRRVMPSNPVVRRLQTSVESARLRPSAKRAPGAVKPARTGLPAAEGLTPPADVADSSPEDALPTDADALVADALQPGLLEDFVPSIALGELAEIEGAESLLDSFAAERTTQDAGFDPDQGVTPRGLLRALIDRRKVATGGRPLGRAGTAPGYASLATQLSDRALLDSQTEGVESAQTRFTPDAPPSSALEAKLRRTLKMSPALGSLFGLRDEAPSAPDAGRSSLDPRTLSDEPGSARDGVAPSPQKTKSSQAVSVAAAAARRPEGVGTSAGRGSFLSRLLAQPTDAASNLESATAAVARSDEASPFGAFRPVAFRTGGFTPTGVTPDSDSRSTGPAAAMSVPTLDAEHLRAQETVEFASDAPRGTSPRAAAPAPRERAPLFQRVEDRASTGARALSPSLSSFLRVEGERGGAGSPLAAAVLAPTVAAEQAQVDDPRETAGTATGDAAPAAASGDPVRGALPIGYGNVQRSVLRGMTSPGIAADASSVRGRGAEIASRPGFTPTAFAGSLLDNQGVPVLGTATQGRGASYRPAGLPLSENLSLLVGGDDSQRGGVEGPTAVPGTTSLAASRVASAISRVQRAVDVLRQRDDRGRGPGKAASQLGPGAASATPSIGFQATAPQAAPSARSWLGLSNLAATLLAQEAAQEAGPAAGPAAAQAAGPEAAPGIPSTGTTVDELAVASTTPGRPVGDQAQAPAPATSPEAARPRDTAALADDRAFAAFREQLESLVGTAVDTTDLRNLVDGAARATLGSALGDPKELAASLTGMASGPIGASERLIAFGNDHLPMTVTGASFGGGLSGGRLSGGSIASEGDAYLGATFSVSSADATLLSAEPGTEAAAGGAESRIGGDAGALGSARGAFAAQLSALVAPAGGAPEAPSVEETVTPAAKAEVSSLVSREQSQVVRNILGKLEGGRSLPASDVALASRALLDAGIDPSVAVAGVVARHGGALPASPGSTALAGLGVDAWRSMPTLRASLGDRVEARSSAVPVTGAGRAAGLEPLRLSTTFAPGLGELSQESTPDFDGAYARMSDNLATWLRPTGGEEQASVAAQTIGGAGALDKIVAPMIGAQGAEATAGMSPNVRGWLGDEPTLLATDRTSESVSAPEGEGGDAEAPVSIGGAARFTTRGRPGPGISAERSVGLGSLRDGLSARSSEAYQRLGGNLGNWLQLGAGERVSSDGRADKTAETSQARGASPVVSALDGRSLARPSSLSPNLAGWIGDKAATGRPGTGFGSRQAPAGRSATGFAAPGASPETRGVAGAGWAQSASELSFLDTSEADQGHETYRQARGAAEAPAASGPSAPSLFAGEGLDMGILDVGFAAGDLSVPMMDRILGGRASLAEPANKAQRFGDSTDASLGGYANLGDSLRGLVDMVDLPEPGAESSAQATAEYQRLAARAVAGSAPEAASARGSFVAGQASAAKTPGALTGLRMRLDGWLKSVFEERRVPSAVTRGISLEAFSHALAASDGVASAKEAYALLSPSGGGATYLDMIEDGRGLDGSGVVAGGLSAGPQQAASGSLFGAQGRTGAVSAQGGQDVTYLSDRRSAEAGASGQAARSPGSFDFVAPGAAPSASARVSFDTASSGATSGSAGSLFGGGGGDFGAGMGPGSALTLVAPVVRAMSEAASYSAKDSGSKGARSQAVRQDVETKVERVQKGAGQSEKDLRKVLPELVEMLRRRLKTERERRGIF